MRSLNIEKMRRHNKIDFRKSRNRFYGSYVVKLERTDIYDANNVLQGWLEYFAKEANGRQYRVETHIEDRIDYNDVRIHINVWPLNLMEQALKAFQAYVS